MFQGLLLCHVALEAQLPVSDPAVAPIPGLPAETQSCSLGPGPSSSSSPGGDPWALECMTSCA